LILTGEAIRQAVAAGRIVVEPFDDARVEPNAYGCTLGDVLLEYEPGEIDARRPLRSIEHAIPPEGFVLQAGRFYLGSTAERIGGMDCASELYGNVSAALAGIFVQTSAPLGHTGAAIRWTLEIVVAQPVRVYAGCRLVKVCFWSNHGEPTPYSGRYVGSDTVVSSKIVQDK
jgi:dCTP deaminase